MGSRSTIFSYRISACNARVRFAVTLMFAQHTSSHAFDRAGEVAASLLADAKEPGTIYVAGALVDSTGSDGNAMWQLHVRPYE